MNGNEDYQQQNQQQTQSGGGEEGSVLDGSESKKGVEGEPGADFTWEDSLLSTLVQGDASVGPAIKAVVEKKRVESFSKCLDSYIDDKEAAIKGICDEHYTHFIQSMETLLEARASTGRLKDAVKEANGKLERAARRILESGNTVLSLRRAQLNMIMAAEYLVVVQHVMSRMEAAEESIESRRYYTALKTLDSVARDHVPHIHHILLARSLDFHIGKLRRRILDAVRAGFVKWLVDVLAKSKGIGEAAYNKVENRLSAVTAQGFQSLAVNGVSAVDAASVNAPLSAAGGTAEGNLGGSTGGVAEVRTLNTSSSKISVIDPSIARESERGGEGDGAKRGQDADDAELLKDSAVDFSPVYQCIRIYDRLGMLEDFQNYYASQRRLQATRALEKPPVQDFARDYPAFFHGIAGFFIIEDHILKTTQRLTTKYAVDGAWESAVNKIKAVYQEQLNYWQDPVAMLKVKDFLVVWIHTMKSYGYDTRLVTDFLEATKTRFAAILSDTFKIGLTQVMAGERWEPLTLYSESEWAAKVASLGLGGIASKYPMRFGEDGGLPQGFGMTVIGEDGEVISEPEGAGASTTEEAAGGDGGEGEIASQWPRTVAFSQMVSLSTELVKEFLVEMYAFAANLANLDEFIKRTVVSILNKDVAGALLGVLNTPAITIPSAVQISVNAAAFEEACGFWESVMMEKRESQQRVVLSTPRKTFNEIKTRADDTVLRLITAKVNSLMASTVNINWTPAQPSGTVHAFITDIQMFLDSVSVYLAFLPQSAIARVHTRIFKHLAGCLLELIKSDSVKKFNAAAVENCSRDLAYVEAMAMASPSPNLANYFAEYRQLINLLLSDNPEGILDASVRQTRYSSVSTGTVITVLDKYREIGQSRLRPGKSNKNKSYEMIVKKLSADL